MAKLPEEKKPLTIDMGKANRLPPRADELMRVVTRFEYALKETGYGVMRNGAVEANWDKFANEVLKAEFLQRVRDKKIAPTILSNPPSRQFLGGSTLDWERKVAPNSIQDFIGAVRRVRNNLVHGGKSGDPDADRNASLVAEAIEVLFEALRSHDDLRFMFEGKW
ncbi:hypothetical protein [Oricola cellulosilytica]|uniref:Uncharacterized protein n=1 Tax=Oricola cellulosilytica TaxID=1429082 RepID=A0A4R0PCN4_9HYPH|nr:hypothetical protein [Oricola cellulosilytica]TCD15231.1 hypothetical protein E0D97_06725 [Oricola cellulosilytica]